MRIIYCDPSLHSNTGHPATHCRFLTRAFQDLGVSSVIMAHKNIEEALAKELGAYRLFQCSPSVVSSQDPLCGWLTSYFDLAKLLAYNLSTVDGIRKDDLVLYDAASPGALWGIILWMQSRAQNCPKVVVSLVEHSGMRAYQKEDGNQEIKPFNHDPTLYRFSGNNLPKDLKKDIRFMSIDNTYSEIYSYMLNLPVHYIAHPYKATTQKKTRSTHKGTLTVGFIGAQRPNKGFQLVPRLVETLLAQTKLNILIQDSRWEMKEELQHLTQMASTEPRIQLITQTLDEHGWAKILDQCDLLVAPYYIESYAIACSGIASEALSNAIPMVVPDNTTLSRLMHEYGTPGVTFSETNEALMIKAILELIDGYDTFAQKALLARELWEKNNGPHKMAEGILSSFNLPYELPQS